MTQSVPMRSMPKQERGERRMQLLLDAAEQTFAELGYKATTTNEIAARAHTSIGTLYRFFPNKEAILQHLTERYVQELRDVRAQMFQPEVAKLPLADLIDRLIDPIVDLKSAHPGLVSLFFAPHDDLQVPAEFQLPVGESLLSIEKLWVIRFPHFDAAQCHLYAVIFYQIRLSFLTLAFSPAATLPPEQIIQELKTNLFRYLEPLDSQQQMYPFSSTLTPGDSMK